MKPKPKTSTNALFFKQHGRPMLLDIAQKEIDSGERLGVLTEHWVAVFPFWATWPFETLLLPRFSVQQMPQLSGVQRNESSSANGMLTSMPPTSNSSVSLSVLSMMHRPK
ncbi:MAG: hypothetical protein ACOVKF_08655 [Limnohabitans sp.]